MEAGTLGNRTTTPAQRDGIGHGLRRLVTETKGSVKTSEFWMSLAVMAGILVSAA